MCCVLPGFRLGFPDFVFGFVMGLKCRQVWGLIEVGARGGLRGLDWFRV